MFKQAARRVFHWLPPAVQQTVRRTRDERRAGRTREAFAAIGADALPALDFNHLLHHLRGEALSRLPQGARHFVSVGCAGTWYFHWIAERCRPRHHTGIEFYTPRPGDLPAGVDWIANTAGNMEALPDGCADLLFSGQNIEHLWRNDVVAFLLESHRVLEPGGLLVVDSPNRRITARLAWSHPEHTIEFTPTEASELLQLAGFDVVRVEGMWLCETGAGELLPFAEFEPGGPWPLARRVKDAQAAAERSFSWWIEARRAHRAPDAVRLRERVEEIHAVAWPERLNRLQTMCGVSLSRADGEWFDSQGRPGALVFGPYTALPPGRHALTLWIELPKAAQGTLEAHVSVGTDARVVAVEHVSLDGLRPGNVHPIRLEFELPDTTFSVQFLVAPPAGARVLARRAVALESAPTP